MVMKEEGDFRRATLTDCPGFRDTEETFGAVEVTSHQPHCFQSFRRIPKQSFIPQAVPQRKVMDKFPPLIFFSPKITNIPVLTVQLSDNVVESVLTANLTHYTHTT